MGGSRHLKRFAAPSVWPIPRKTAIWTVKPSPGPHPADYSIPLAIILRDMLGYANNMREVRFIINGRMVLVDGVARRDPGFPVGVMDVISIPKTEEHYRILPDRSGRLILHRVSDVEARFKLCKIIGKTMLKRGRLQLNLHDGRNVLVKIADPMHPVEDVYHTHDALQLSIPENVLMSHIPLKEGTLCLIVRGRNIGRIGYLVENIPGSLASDPKAVLEDDRGERFETVLEYIFPIGIGKPLISLPKTVTEVVKRG
ncbi:MAG: 30S ribosomal protein S4e [Nitrososphaerota archaeon]|nr:30S ribosomal protein S4e [Candidatus Bathyarchaeota archaeon]MDW8062055.1 30S ribosomal protein S4e [Nitrososphaerota archaeon]